jgi:hypothetical protein
MQLLRVKRIMRKKRRLHSSSLQILDVSYVSVLVVVLIGLLEAMLGSSTCYLFSECYVVELSFFNACSNHCYCELA